MYYIKTMYKTNEYFTDKSSLYNKGEEYTFKIRAYEEGTTPITATTEQYNDKTFIYTVLANPSCVSPASNKICPN